MWRTGPAARVESDLFVERYGGGFALSHRDDQPFLLWHLLRLIVAPTEEVPIRFTASAGRHPDAHRVVRNIALGAARDPGLTGGPARLRLGSVAIGRAGAIDADLVSRLASAVDGSLLVDETPLALPRPPAIFGSGWRRAADRLYHLGHPSQAVAEVLPAGILLRPERTYAVGSVAVFYPNEWTIVIGSPGRPVPPAVVAMLRRVLAGSMLQDSRLRIAVAGQADRPTLDRIAALAEAADVAIREGSRERSGVAVAGPRSSGPTVTTGHHRDAARQTNHPLWTASSHRAEVPFGPAAAAGPVLPGPAVVGPAVATGRLASSPAVATGRLARSPEPAVVSGVDALPGLVSPLSGPPVVTMADPERTAHAGDPTYPVPLASQSIGDGSITGRGPVGGSWAGPPSAAGPTPGWRPAPAPSVADRDSTADEQRRFGAALGDRFTDLLALVNGALAAWPVLRRDGVIGAKADLVAVCLYLGSSEQGAVRLNLSLRGGPSIEEVDGYLPCLVSGLRQLPLHRRPLLSQARLGQSADSLYRVGSVLTEPALLSASVAMDVAVDGADVDFLIAPRAARQASVLGGDRDTDEAVFPPGTRFRVLAVTSEPAVVPEQLGASERAVVLGHSADVPVDPGRPETAVLLRELLPHEQPTGPDLDDVDRAALGRLEPALRQRRQQPARRIDEPDMVARLGTTPPGYVAVGAAGHQGSAQ